MKLVVKQNTVFKQYAIDSSKLGPQDKTNIAAGRSFEIHSWKPAGPFHWKVALINQFLGDPPRNTWYVFAPHIQLIDSQGLTLPLPTDPKPSTPTLVTPIPFTRLPSSKRLSVPYYSQLNNADNPRGACNVTCFAMVMNYFKIPRKTNAMQFADELYRYMDNNGLSRHEPQDLFKLAEAYGLRDELTLRGRATDIRKAIAEGKPCIIHGYFTSFGHIVTILGYDKDGFIVNDPFGEWTANGYIEGPYGGGLHYSNNLIQGTCSPEGPDYMWLHRLSRK
ncbi:MAG: C39 family peptidase [Alkalinema sp. FL-bin-369]|nr:C39 family peptidase [Leptolyngbyaceae cyanobacterium LF-bin-369]